MYSMLDGLELCNSPASMMKGFSSTKNCFTAPFWRICGRGAICASQVTAANRNRTINNFVQPIVLNLPSTTPLIARARDEAALHRPNLHLRIVTTDEDRVVGPLCSYVLVNRGLSTHRAQLSDPDCF